MLNGGRDAVRVYALRTQVTLTVMTTLKNVNTVTYIKPCKPPIASIKQMFGDVS